MLSLFTDEEFEKAKSRDKLPLKCKHCGETFYRTKHIIQMNESQNKPKDCCSLSCKATHQYKGHRVDFDCEQCGKLANRALGHYKKVKHHFCSQSCSATYYNQRKQTGIRRSKFEVWVEEQLVSLYPNLEFHFNRKDTILSELDIYIPELKLAFEINGIFHYEPIFGQDKLDRTQKNEKGKFAACIEKNIGLCIIDISTLNYFKPKKAQKFLDIITNIIDQTLSLNS